MVEIYNKAFITSVLKFALYSINWEDSTIRRNWASHRTFLLYLIGLETDGVPIFMAKEAL